MPKLSRWMIRTALGYLAAGFFLGALLLAKKAYPELPVSYKLLPVHTELLIFGWTLQLVMGVAYWILPRFSSARPRGPEWPVLLAIFLLNGGVLLVLLAELSPASPGLLIFGRIMEAGSAIAFALHAWPRVKAFSGSNSG